MTVPAPPGESTWSLRVGRAEFAKALRSVGRAGRAVHAADAILTMDAGHLVIELAASSFRLPAEGTWPSEARIPGIALERLARALPDEDPLPLQIQGERLHVARFSIPCTWRMYSKMPSTPVKELISANAELFDILLARSRCSADEIDAAGAAPLVADAEARLHALCAKAAAVLRTYRVTTRDVQALCERHIEDGSRQFCDADRPAVRLIAQVWELLAPFGVEPHELKSLMDSRLRNAWRNSK